MTLDLSNRTYYTRFSRDIFMFSYLMAGINFKDIALLKWANIVNGRIYYNRKKTGKVMNCKLSTEALRIIERYSKTHAQDGYIFLILDKREHKTERQILNRVHKVLKKINAHLNELGTEIGLNIPLTTYVARHTFATVMKRSGVSMELISESLGHSNLTTTQIYLDSFENSQMDEAMQNLV